MSFGLSSTSTQASGTPPRRAPQPPLPPPPQFAPVPAAPRSRYIDLAVSPTNGSSSATTQIPEPAAPRRRATESLVREMRRKAAGRKILRAMKKRRAARKQRPQAQSGSTERKVREMRRKAAGRKVARALRGGVKKMIGARKPRSLEELPQNKAIRAMQLPLGMKIRVDGKVYEIAERMFAGKKIRYPRRVAEEGKAAKARGVPVRAKGDKEGTVKTLGGKAFRLTKIVTKAGKEMLKWKKVSAARKATSPASASSFAPPALGAPTSTETHEAEARKSKSKSRSKSSSKSRSKSSSESRSKSSSKSRSKSSSKSRSASKSKSKATSSSKSRSRSSTRVSGAAAERKSATPSPLVLLSPPKHTPRRAQPQVQGAGGEAARKSTISALEERLRQLRGSPKGGKGARSKGAAAGKAIVIAPSCISFVLKPACREKICGGGGGGNASPKRGKRKSRSPSSSSTGTPPMIALPVRR